MSQKPSTLRAVCGIALTLVLGTYTSGVTPATAATPTTHNVVAPAVANAAPTSVHAFAAIPTTAAPARTTPVLVNPVTQKAAALPAVVKAAASTPASGNNGNPTNGAGDFAATPGAASDQWAAGGPTGSFTWSYPLKGLPVPAGPAPALSLSYDSSRVDGMTSATNSQPSNVGDGWALAGAGQISQAFIPCSDAGYPTSYDLCQNPNGQQLQVSFGGRSGALVKDATTGTWKLQNDDNTKVDYVVPATRSNITADGGYWKLTTSDGTQ